MECIHAWKNTGDGPVRQPHIVGAGAVEQTSSQNVDHDGSRAEHRRDRCDENRDLDDLDVDDHLAFGRIHSLAKSKTRATAPLEPVCGMPAYD